jgi:hypothetical protein
LRGLRKIGKATAVRIEKVHRPTIQLSSEEHAAIAAGEPAMGTRKPTYTKEEHARRGRATYEKIVRPQVEAGQSGRVVALDVDTGAFEVADNPLAASERLLAHHPDAQIWCVRVGQPAVYRYGTRVQTT